MKSENNQDNYSYRLIAKKKIIFNIAITIIIYFLVIFLVVVAYQGYRAVTKNTADKQQITSASTIITTTTTTSSTTTTTTRPVIKDSLVLNVPYTVQAPYANWDVHEESCEEAAVLMARDYLEGVKYTETVIDKEIANSSMVAMKYWQQVHYGSEPDLTIEGIGKFAAEYYGYNYEYKENITDYDIKLAINQGYPVIVPVMTHSLYNPNYGAHTVYHVLLIKGYDSTGVITNDAGVKEGENWHYTWDVLFGAIDAQTSQMGQGRVMVVIKK